MKITHYLIDKELDAFHYLQNRKESDIVHFIILFDALLLVIIEDDPKDGIFAICFFVVVFAVWLEVVVDEGNEARMHFVLGLLERCRQEDFELTLRIFNSSFFSFIVESNDIASEWVEAIVDERSIFRDRNVLTGVLASVSERRIRVVAVSWNGFCLWCSWDLSK